MIPPAAVTDPRLEDTEWLETNGLGSYASGIVAGPRSRRDHAILAIEVKAKHRSVLVNGFDAWIETPNGKFAITSQRYHPDVVSPDGANRIVGFEADPWPRWRFRLEDGTHVEQEIVMRQGAALTAVAWRVRGPRIGTTLTLRPFLSVREAGALHFENPSFRFDPSIAFGRLVWRPYPGMPGIVVAMNGEYSHHPLWYRKFTYGSGGVNGMEDLASPGVLRWSFSNGEAIWMVAAEGREGEELATNENAEWCLAAVRDAERARRK